MSDEVARTVREILSLSLGREIGQDERPSRATEPAWDSLQHIEIVFNLEAEFGITFDPEEMALLDSQDAIVERIEAGRAPRANG